MHGIVSDMGSFRVFVAGHFPERYSFGKLLGQLEELMKFSLVHGRIGLLAEHGKGILRGQREDTVFCAPLQNADTFEGDCHITGQPVLAAPWRAVE